MNTPKSGPVGKEFVSCTSSELNGWTKVVGGFASQGHPKVWVSSLWLLCDSLDVVSTWLKLPP